MFLTFGRKLSNSYKKYIMILTFKKKGLNSIHVAVKIIFVQVNDIKQKLLGQFPWQILNLIIMIEEI